MRNLFATKYLKSGNRWLMKFLSAGWVVYMVCGAVMVPNHAPSILLAAHMDAIGLMVIDIKDGLLRFTKVGGVDTRVLPGQLVTVHGRQDLQSVVVQPPDYLLPSSQAGRSVEMQYLFVDTGFHAQDVSDLVRIGDLISFAQPPMELSGDTLAGHSLDNRASVAAVTHCLIELKNMQHAWDVLAVATVQEEENLSGAITSPFELRPPIAVAIDVGFAKGPGANDWRTIALSKGPSLGWGPNIHPYIFNGLQKLLNNMTFQAKKILCRIILELMPMQCRWSLKVYQPCC